MVSKMKGAIVSQLKKWLSAFPLMEAETRIVQLELELAQWRSVIASHERLSSKP